LARYCATLSARPRARKAGRCYSGVSQIRPSPSRYLANKALRGDLGGGGEAILLGEVRRAPLCTQAQTRCCAPYPSTGLGFHKGLSGALGGGGEAVLLGEVRCAPQAVPRRARI